MRPRPRTEPLLGIDWDDAQTLLGVLGVVAAPAAAAVYVLLSWI